MKRNFSWALISISPLIVLLSTTGYVHFIDSYNIDIIPISWHNIDLVRFWQANWWKIIGLILISSYFFFLVHSLWNKRWVWFLGIFFLWMFLYPFYWWFNSEKNT